MPGPMPEHLVKTYALRDLDTFLSNPANEAERNKLLAELQKSPDDEAVILARYGILKRDREFTAEDADTLKLSERKREINDGILRPDGDKWLLNEVLHMQKEWFAPSGQGGWWSADAGPMEPILRRALIEVIQLVNATGLPVDSYWLCAGGDNSPDRDMASPGIHCFVTWSPNQITSIILTPEEPAGKHHTHAGDGDPTLTGKKERAINERKSGIIVVKPTMQAMNPQIQPVAAQVATVAKAYDFGDARPEPLAAAPDLGSSSSPPSSSSASPS